MVERKSSFLLTNPKKRRFKLAKELICHENGIRWYQIDAISLQGGFLSLPIEVRNKVYRYILNEEDDIKPKKEKERKWNNELGQYKAIDSCTTLSQASRQLFVDVSCSGLLYSTNDFHFLTPHHLSAYLTFLNHHHRALSFRTIHLRIPITPLAPNIQPSLTTLSSLTSSRQLHLEFDCRTSISMIASSHQTRRRIYRVKQEVPTKLSEVNWGLLGAKLVNFEVKSSVSPKTEKDWRFWTFHDEQDERVEELKVKIDGFVLRRRREDR